MSRWNWIHTLVVGLIALLVIGYAAFPLFLDKSKPAGNITTWIIIGVLLVIFSFTVGYGVTGKFLGILIDERNRMSLSRFQLILWTIVILSGWISAAIWNLAIENSTNPLTIALPAQIWALLGISTTSLVGTPIILKEKAKKRATRRERDASLRRIASREGRNLDLPVDQTDLQNADPQSRIARISTRETEINNAAGNIGVAFKGQVVTRTSIDDASVANLFQGDEVGNDGYVDIGKIQMFFFTLILVLAYALAIGTALTTGTEANTITSYGIHRFPVLDEGMIALLAISHAGYLAYKAAPHTETEDD